MAKTPELIDRAIQFWDRHASHPYLIDDRSLSLLETVLTQLKEADKLTLEHFQSLVLCVALCESQIRDCIRLAIDAPFMDIDIDNPTIKEVRLDIQLLSSVRDRHLTLGGFFALSTSISTVGRFWSGLEFGFKGYDLPSSVTTYAKARLPDITFDQIKASLAFIYSERNRYVHEFSKLVVDSIGKSFENAKFLTAFEHVLLLLRCIQDLKINQYNGKYGESAPSRKDVGKELNALTEKMSGEYDELNALLRAYEQLPERELPRHHSPQDIRKSVYALRASHNDFLFRLSAFIYYALGPGTIVHDFIYGAHLDQLKLLEGWLAEAIRHQAGMKAFYTESAHED
jgi:hypothetical protein